MAINVWRKSTMNVKFGFFAGNSRCWGYCFNVDTVNTQAFLFSLSVGQRRIWPALRQREWPARKQLTPGTHSVNHEALVATDKILLPPFHIKLELVKRCVKALDNASDSWQHICYMFPLMFWRKIEVERSYWTTNTADATVKIFGRINCSYVVNSLEGFSVSIAWILR